ncbi:hypothetical protein VTK73DRAFT_5702 [Phialemonium thermophilum]|uniref:Uncharacterized protein n=1 Tax=Phialemonium thermophilum TaxID=223376 RepID=A0ABR3V0W0_9PEZI
MSDVLRKKQRGILLAIVVVSCFRLFLPPPFSLGLYPGCIIISWPSQRRVFRGVCQICPSFVSAALLGPLHLTEHRAAVAFVFQQRDCHFFFASGILSSGVLVYETRKVSKRHVSFAHPLRCSFLFFYLLLFLPRICLSCLPYLISRSSDSSLFLVSSLRRTIHTTVCH